MQPDDLVEEVRQFGIALAEAKAGRIVLTEKDAIERRQVFVKEVLKTKNFMVTEIKALKFFCASIELLQPSSFDDMKQIKKHLRKL